MKNNFTIFFAFLIYSSLTYGSERTVSRGGPFAKYLENIKDCETPPKPDPNLNFLEINDQSDIILLRLEEEREFSSLLLTEAGCLASLNSDEDFKSGLKEIEETAKKRIEELESWYQKEDNRLKALEESKALIAAQATQAQRKKSVQRAGACFAGLAVAGVTFYGARHTKRGQEMTQAAMHGVKSLWSPLSKPIAGLFAGAAVASPVVLNAISESAMPDLVQQAEPELAITHEELHEDPLTELRATE